MRARVPYCTRCSTCEKCSRGGIPTRTGLSSGAISSTWGGFRNLVHNHDPALPLALDFNLDLSAVDLVDFVEGPVAIQAASSRSDPADQSAALTRQLDEGGSPQGGEASPKPGQARQTESLLDRLSADARTATVRLTVKWSEIASEPVQADYEVGINGEAAARIRTDPSSGTLHTVEANLRHPSFYGPPEQQDQRAATNLDSSNEDWVAFRPLEAGLARAVRRPHETLFDEIRAVLSLFDLDEFPEVLPFALTAPGEFLLRQLNDLRYLGPIREVPSRTHVPARSPDLSRWANGLGAWDWISLASNEQLGDLNAWLTREDRLNTGYRVDVKRYKELNVDSLLMLGLMDSTDLLDNYLSIREELDALPVKFASCAAAGGRFFGGEPSEYVGIGISQVIPVIVSALDGGDRMTVIEQPELHIHPAIQVALGDLFIQAARSPNGVTAPCFLIETHSEHLLLRLLRRLRETAEGATHSGVQLTPEYLAVYFVEATSAGTVIRSLPVDEQGNFTERWPRGFFDEREKEFFGGAEPVSDEELKRCSADDVEYAVSPALFDTDAHLAFLYEAFGKEPGRLVSEFPRRRWDQLARAVIAKYARDEYQRHQWTEALIALMKRALYPRPGSQWNHDKGWTENAIAEHERSGRPRFHGILVDGSVAPRPDVITIGSGMGEHKCWVVPRERVRRSQGGRDARNGGASP